MKCNGVDDVQLGISIWVMTDWQLFEWSYLYKVQEDLIETVKTLWPNQQFGTLKLQCISNLNNIKSPGRLHNNNQLLLSWLHLSIGARSRPHLVWGLGRDLILPPFVSQNFYHNDGKQKHSCLAKQGTAHDSKHVMSWACMGGHGNKLNSCLLTSIVSIYNIIILFHMYFYFIYLWISWCKLSCLTKSMLERLKSSKYIPLWEQNVRIV